MSGQALWGAAALVVSAFWVWVLWGAAADLIDGVTFTGVLRLVIEAIAAVVTTGWLIRRARSSATD